METTIQKVYNQSQAARAIGCTPQNLSNMIRSGLAVPDVLDGEGAPRWFSPELVAQLKRDFERRQIHRGRTHR